jgi:hypothetical protein
MVITAEVRNNWPRRIELYHKDFTQSEDWRITNLSNNFEIDVNYQQVTIDVGVTSRFFKIVFSDVQFGGQMCSLREIEFMDASGLIIPLVNSRIDSPTIALSKPGADAALLFDNQDNPLAAPAWSVPKSGGAYVVLEPKRAVTSVELYGSNKNTFPLINTLMHGPTATGPWTLTVSRSTRDATIFGANYTIWGRRLTSLGPWSRLIRAGLRC